MKENVIHVSDAGQRLDKYLKKYLNNASSGFIYKMLRKKNIKINGMKASGNEMLQAGDCIQIYLSDDTIAKFRKQIQIQSTPAAHIHVLYEDEDILILDKPVGILSQKSKPKDLSLNDEMLTYLLETGAVSATTLETFRPSLVNRLDRNTSGIILAGKTLRGTQFLTEIIRNRTLEKYYGCIVCGNVSARAELHGFLQKDEATNSVKISHQKTVGSSEIHTTYEALCTTGNYSLLEVELITGKSHQIRAHLASEGHPIVGDPKYLDKNRFFEAAKLTRYQMLYAKKIVFPHIEGTFSHLSGRVFETDLPTEFTRVLKKTELYNLLNK